MEIVRNTGDIDEDKTAELSIRTVAWLVAAGMAKARGLDVHQGEAWADAHYKDQLQGARLAVDNAELFNEEVSKIS